METLKNIFRVIVSNIIGRSTGFLVTFFFPIILSLEDYGNYQKYVTLLSFTYLFNLGYNDGIYIKYGGKNINELSRKTIQREHNFILLFQLAFFLLIFLYAIFTKNTIYVFFSIVTLFDCLNTYHANFLQATGNFKKYTLGNNLKNLIYVLLLLIGIFLFKFDNYYIYIIFNILSFLTLTIYFEFTFLKEFNFSNTLSTKNIIPIFKVGVIVLIANASLTFVANVGRLVVQYQYPSEIFAYYSFQNSILNLILVLASSIGLVFFNLISKTNNQDTFLKIKNLSMLMGISAGILFFPIKALIIFLYPQFIPSISILSITFLSIPYLINSKILIANLYKAHSSNRVYLRDSLLCALLSFVIVYGLNLITHDLWYIALGTTITYILWYFYTTTFKFPYLKSSFSEWLILIISSIIFIICSNFFDNFLGLIVYVINIFIVLFFKRNEISILLKKIKN